MLLTGLIRFADLDHFIKIHPWLSLIVNTSYMILQIHDGLIVEDIQDQFSKCFPHLKLELYSTAHHWKKGSAQENVISPKVSIGDIRKKQSAGTLEIKSSDKVGDVETKFKKIFGLNVQIFRKENDCWIQTTTTDVFTIGRQADLSKKSKTTLLGKLKEQADEYDYL